MRVLLSGYYGFGNLGDEAILAGLGGALKAHGHEPLVLSHDPAATKRQHGFRAHHRTWGLPAALAAADAVVSGGGGLLQDTTSARSLAYYLWVLRLARLSGRPTAVYGQSLGPLSAAGRSQVGRVLQGVPLFVRDRQSLTLAADLGLEARLVGDAALLLVAEHAPENGGENAPVVLVPRGGHDAYNRALEELALRLVARGTPVVVMVLHPAEDRLPGSAVAAAANGAETWTPDSPAAAVAMLRRAGYVVSARLHGCILAAVAGTAFAGLAYDPKVSGFLDQLGAPGFAAPLDVGSILAAVDERRPTNRQALDGLTAAAHDGVADLLAALRSVAD